MKVFQRLQYETTWNYSNANVSSQVLEALDLSDVKIRYRKDTEKIEKRYRKEGLVTIRRRIVYG